MKNVDFVAQMELFLEALFKDATTRDNAIVFNYNPNYPRYLSFEAHKLIGAIKNLSKFERDEKFEDRIKIQRETLNYGILPTTTIGSFPQTVDLRVLRQNFKKGEIDAAAYEAGIKKYIDHCVKFQEDIGLDVLVHGEPERNDMVEYFERISST